jgi:DNA-binding GntR family transcriptional regulator
MRYQAKQSSGLRHNLVSHILRLIFEGHLKDGEHLVVQRLAHKHGVSATPAREALLELNSIGVVEMLPNRGAVVRPFGGEQLRDIYQLRRILEVEAARSCCGRIDVEALHSLREEMMSLKQDSSIDDWSEKAMSADRRLHEVIAKSSGNPRLVREIERYNILVQAVRDVVGNAIPAQLEAIDDHLAIIDAVVAGDAQQAQQAMARHIGNAEAIFMRAMFPEFADANGHGAIASQPQQAASS